MRKIFFITVVSLLVYSSQATAQFKYDVSGRPVTEISYTEIDGDPYLISEWVEGTINMPGNKTAIVPLKYDIYTNRLLYKGKDGEILEPANKVTGFSLTPANEDLSSIKPMVFANGFPAVEKQNENTWYELVGDGKVKLLKYYGKQVLESKAYNSATTTKSFLPFQAYYISKNNQLTKVSINKKAVLKALDDHSAQIDAYIKSNNINFKSDADLQKLFGYYNSLN